MAGLIAAIHVLSVVVRRLDVDARHKAGHDNLTGQSLLAV